MKIIFNLMYCGLGNNGGSQTIIESANILQQLRHEVILVDTMPIRNTWNLVKVPHIIITNEMQIPDGDVIIGTGVNTFMSTKSSKIKKKFLWIRGIELWSNKNFYQIVKNCDCNNITMCNQLQQHLNNHGITSDVIMPGYDYELFKPLKIRQKNKKPIVGFLFNSGKKRITKRIEWIFELMKDRNITNMCNFITFGVEGNIKKKYDNKFIFYSPDNETKNQIYNKCNLWLAPACLDGWQWPPTEAGLTECCVVGTNAELNGMKDYLIHNETGIMSDDNYESFKNEFLNILYNTKLQNKLGKNLRKKVLTFGTREDNMKKLIDLINSK